MQIPLTKGAYALIDTEDFDRVAQHGWCLADQFKTPGYVRAFANIKNKIVKLHRFILEVTDPTIEIDHIDRDPLNNTKANLRIVSRSENQANRQSKGYCYNKEKDTWEAYVQRDGKRLWREYFKTETEAKTAVKLAREEYDGKE